MLSFIVIVNQSQSCSYRYGGTQCYGNGAQDETRSSTINNPVVFGRVKLGALSLLETVMKL